MADTVEEFVNLANQTYVDINAGITIVTTGASEQAVVREIKVTTDNTDPLTVGIGSTTLYELPAGSSLLEGTEVVDSSQTMTLNVVTPIVPVVNKFYRFVDNSNWKNYTIPTIFTPNLELVTTATIESGTVSGSYNWINGDQHFYWIDDNGDAYGCSATSGTSPLWKKVGGFAALVAPTNEGVIGGAVCVDYANDVIYGFTSATELVKYVCSTGVRTTHTVAVTGLDVNVASASIADGYLYLVADVASFTTYMIKLSDYTQVALTEPWSLSGSTTITHSCIAQKRSDGDIFVCVGDTLSSTDYLHWAIYEKGTAAAVSSGTLSGTGFDLVGLIRNWQNHMFKQSEDDGFVYFGWAITGGTTYSGWQIAQVDVASPLATAADLKKLDFSDNEDVHSGGAFVLRLDSSLAVPDYGYLSVRSTGVRMT